MKYQENRMRFLRRLGRLSEQLQLTPGLKELMKRDRLFGEHMDLMKHMSDEQKKMVILLELTRKRDTCDALIDLLQVDGQTDLAKKITERNRSPERMSLVWKPLPRGLPVSPSWGALGRRSDGSKLDKRIRGRFYIVNNVEEPQRPDLEDNGQVQQRLGLRYESDRFEQIFRDLHFEVERLVALNAEQLKDTLIEICNEASLKEDQAFGLMVISHGQDEKVYGFEACEANRKKNFGEPQMDSDKTDCNVIDKDLIAIKDIIDIFANCGFLSGIPKLLFFNCCRIERNKSINEGLISGDSEHSSKSLRKSVMMTTEQWTGSLMDPFSHWMDSYSPWFVPERRTHRSDRKQRSDRQHNSEPSKPTYYDDEEYWSRISRTKYGDDWDKPTLPKSLVPTDTFVAYACAKGYESFFNEFHGFSYFGQALSHSIAQYACEESLSSIMSRTQYLLKLIYEANQDKYNEGDFSTEVISYAMSKQLYFNPGHFRKFES